VIFSLILILGSIWKFLGSLFGLMKMTFNTDSYEFFLAYYNKFLGVTCQIYDKISRVTRDD